MSTAALSDFHAAPAARTAAQARLELRALSYRRVVPQPDDGHAAPVASAGRLGEFVGNEAMPCMSRVARIDDYVVSGTIMSGFLMDGSPSSRAFHDAIRQRTGRALDWLTSSYECAGWGYVMRYVLEKAALTGPRTLLLQIVDIDVHDFSYWWTNDNWGNSGFGVCSILVRAEPGESSPVRVGAAAPASAMVQMGRALKDFSAARPGVPVAVPFFREASRNLLLKRIEGSPVHADGYAEYGHSFGSDPWISLLKTAAAEGRTFRKSIVNSLALYGYFAMAEIDIAEDAPLELEYGP